MEGYTTNTKLSDREERAKAQNYHILLLAKNREGYQNLMKLTSIAHLEGYYYRPRVDRETLAKYSKGLICTSGCPRGELPQVILNDGYDSAKKVAQWFLDVFDKDYYLEVQRHKYRDFALASQNDELKSLILEMAKNDYK